MISDLTASVPIVARLEALTKSVILERVRGAAILPTADIKTQIAETAKAKGCFLM